MNPVFVSKPSSFALYTNEMENGDHFDTNSANENDGSEVDDLYFHSNDDNTSKNDESISVDSNVVDIDARDDTENNSITGNGLKKLSIDDCASNDSTSSQSVSKSPRKKAKTVRPDYIEIEAKSDDDNNLSTPRTASSKSRSNKKSGKNRMKEFITSSNNKKDKLFKKLTAYYDARNQVQNKKTIVSKEKNNSIKGNDDVNELISFKKEVFQHQSNHDKEKLQIEQTKMKFDERRLQLEEMTYYANEKRDIATHNLQMLKMRKEAREEYKDEFNEKDLEAMFPFRKFE